MLHNTDNSEQWFSNFSMKFTPHKTNQDGECAKIKRAACVQSELPLTLTLKNTQGNDITSTGKVMKTHCPVTLFYSPQSSCDPWKLTCDLFGGPDP